MDQCQSKVSVFKQNGQRTVLFLFRNQKPKGLLYIGKMTFSILSHGLKGQKAYKENTWSSTTATISV